MLNFATPSTLPNVVTRSLQAVRLTHVCVLEIQRVSPSPSNNAPIAVPARKDKTFRPVEPQEDRASLPPPPPVHRSIPLVGYLVENWLQLNFPARRAKKYGRIYRSNFLFEDLTYIADMDVITDILHTPSLFSNNVGVDQLAALIGDDNLVTMDGPRHAAQRALIAPAFSPSMFPYYFDSIRAASKRLWHKIEADAGKDHRLRIDPRLREHYVSIIVELSAGVDGKHGLAGELCDKFHTMIQGVIGPPFGPLWSRAMRAKKEVEIILQGVMHDKLIRQADLIESLRIDMKSGKALTLKNRLKGGGDIMLIVLAGSDLPTGPGQDLDSAVLADVTSLMLLIWLAGYATSASTTACALFEAGMDQDIMEQLRAEQDNLMAKEGTREVTYEQVQSSMPLLSSYIQEITRLRPAGDGIMRLVLQDMVILNKYVKAGTKLYCDLSAAMRDERMYEQAEEIQVDRFMKNANKAAPPKSLAFGGPKSPHYCVGAALAKMLIKTNMAVLLRDYDLKLDSKQERRYRVIPDNSPASEVLLKSIKRRH